MKQDKWRETYYCDLESGHKGGYYRFITGIIPAEHKAPERMTAGLRQLVASSWGGWHRSSPRRAAAHKIHRLIDLLLSKNGAVVRRFVSGLKRS